MAKSYMSGGFNIKDLLSDESEEFSDKVSDQENVNLLWMFKKSEETLLRI